MPPATANTRNFRSICTSAYLSSQTSSMRQPLKMLLTITVSPFTRGCQHVAARRAAAVIDDRPGTVLRQLPFDLPYELLPILLVGFHRLLVDQFIHVRTAISTIVHFRTTRVVPVEIIVGI